MNRIILTYLLLGVLLPYVLTRTALQPLAAALAEQDQFLAELNDDLTSHDPNVGK